MDKPLNRNQYNALFYVHKHETPEYGVIVRAVTAQSLIDNGYANLAPRRSYAREAGLSIRLTAKGKAYIKSLS